MASLEVTVLARSPHLLLDRAQALGLDRDDPLEASGFTEPELRDLDPRVSRAGPRAARSSRRRDAGRRWHGSSPPQSWRPAPELGSSAPPVSTSPG
ncbi:MAG: hypothetical protein GY719_01575 [bacterium]|nr:hypothetical protein [bacterium]